MQPAMKMYDMGTQEGRDAVGQYELEHAAKTTQGQQIYAQIKRSSRYFGQTGAKEIFPVYVETHKGEYVVQGGPGGQYRLRDVNLLVVGEDGAQLRIS